MIDWSKPIEFVDPAIGGITIKNGGVLSNGDQSVEIIRNGSAISAFMVSAEGTPHHPIILSNFIKENYFTIFTGPPQSYNIRNKKLSTNEELDEVLGELKNDYLKEQVTPADSLEQSLGRIHRDLTDTLLRVEAQAFALFVKKQKGTDIAEDYYQFRKHG